MSTTHSKGGCLCGAVRFEAAGKPYRVGICHCLDCRKHHGAVFLTFAIYPATAVTITGETADYRGRCFCPVCGSSVFGELWTARREAWLPAFDVARRFDGDRTGKSRSEP